MKTHVICTLVIGIATGFPSLSAHAFEVPKDFEKQTTFASDSNFWMQPKSLETISLSVEDTSRLQDGKDDLTDIADVMKRKGKTLSQVLNIKEYKVLSSKETKSKTGKFLYFFGSYIDSGDELTHFAEVYEIPKTGQPNAYLFTRNQKAWTPSELADRFKVGR